MTLMFESTSSVSCVFVFDVKNSLSKQESKCLCVKYVIFPYL